MKIQVLSPAAECAGAKVQRAARLASLDGKTIGLYNNNMKEAGGMTGGADVAVERIAEHLKRRYPNVRFERYGGDLRPGRPALGRVHHIDQQEAVRIAAEVDAMVGATAH